MISVRVCCSRTKLTCFLEAFLNTWLKMAIKMSRTLCDSIKLSKRQIGLVLNDPVLSRFLWTLVLSSQYPGPRPYFRHFHLWLFGATLALPSSNTYFQTLCTYINKYYKLYQLFCKDSNSNVEWKRLFIILYDYCAI